ncbi:MAG TPA: TolC family protein, partial [Candidatus Sulfotelmatobacter sp.]|nr:TolC family protein [Candidatus Sulfotelmatobacter sp.]
MSTPRARAVFGAIVAGAILLTIGTVWAGETTLTLSEAVHTALERHPALQAAGYQVQAASSAVDQARAGFLPRVDFSEGVTRGDNPVYAFGSLLNQGRFTQADFAVDRLNHPDPISNWRTNLSGSVPIFTGGRTILGFQQAKIGVDAARSSRERAEQETIFGVVRAYSAFLLAEEAKATFDASVRTAEANLATAETRVEAGLAVASDALSARVRLARLQEESIAAANHIRLARAALNEAVGFPLDSARPVSGRLSLPEVRQERL